MKAKYADADLPVRVGLIGCGDISDDYCRANQQFSAFEIVACTDVVAERATDKAREYGFDQCASMDEFLARNDIEVVLNLTPPQAHASIALTALIAGKHVYSEKPFAISLDDGQRLLQEAEERGLSIGCAPDTFLGPALQTCRGVIDSGRIGEPVACTAFMMCPGHESWHPRPEIFYCTGGGPVFDMGPYYLTALVHLLGPIRRVAAAARTTFRTRTITTSARRGEQLQVEVPTHVAGVVDFECGVVGSMVMSFDICISDLPHIEIYGTLGTLRVPDPNRYKGNVAIKLRESEEWIDVQLLGDNRYDIRGIGLADMAQLLGSDELHRANGRLAYHVLEAMCGLHESSNAGQHVLLKSTCDRPQPLSLA